MQLSPGQLLQGADPDDSLLGDARILLVQCNGQGAAGLVLGKPFGRALNELEEFRNAPAVPLFWGGPVDAGHLFFIHRRPDLIAESEPISNGVCFGGRFSDAVAALKTGALTPQDLLVFVGYCGWDAGDLEGEIEAGYWEPAAQAAIFP